MNFNAFNDFEEKLQKHFKKMTEHQDNLFEVEVDKNILWNLYLDSFPEGTNEIYRERRKYDCCCCRQFIKKMGNVVVIKDNKITTIWDFESNEIFQPVADALSSYIKSNKIKDVFITMDKRVGTIKNGEVLKNGDIIEWDHLYLDIPEHVVTKKNELINTIEGTKGFYRTNREVFKRSLEEITSDSVLIVLDLISQNSLYKGEEWKHALNSFIDCKKTYESLDENSKDLYAWEMSLTLDVAITKIKNHSIGTLLMNISEGMDLDTAVRKYETIVAPENYKRSKPVYTKKMLEEAQKTVEDLGYMGSLERRYATLDDITINNILFSNKDSAKRIIGENVFDEMLEDVVINPRKFSKVEEITIDKFIQDILPNTKELEVLLENKHKKSMVSLIAPKNKDSKTMFKWNNNFGWAYSGNITDSSMKENVKSAGGKVDGVLRFSIQWNDESEFDKNDLDAHCIEPGGFEIYYGDKMDNETKGQLDIDIINPQKGKPAVENITWPDKDKMLEGTYKFFVNNYANRGGRNGFKAEIEFNGQIYSFEYNKELKQDENVNVAEVTFNRNTGFTIKERIASDFCSKEVWSLKTNNFVPVSVVMLSPNYWSEEFGIGNKHYFFMLKGCVNPESPNGFYNEFLKQDLIQHRKVFEALGSRMKVEETEEQLSGIGFSSTKRNDLIVKVKGNTERIIKIKF